MKYILIFIFIIGTVSCSDNEEIILQIGEEFVGSNSKVYFIDSLTVNASTFQFDSLIVSNTNRLLIGTYQDSVFGKIQSKSYLRLVNEIYDIDNDAIYDSIALVLKYDNYFYNDTIPLQQYQVFELTENIEPDEFEYYNTTDIEYGDIPIATKSFYPNPIKEDSLNIEVLDTFGEELFNNIRDNVINDNFEFQDEYNGLAIVANENNTSVIGFAKDSFLRIYYTIEDEDEVIEKTIDITIDPVNTFNQTISDQTETYFDLIVDQETILPSDETDDTCFIQSGIGIVTRIDIPYIKTLNDIPGDGVVVDAKLKFTLKRNTYDKQLHTRDSLRAFIIDKNVFVVKDLITTNGLAIGLIEDENTEFDTDTYVMDIKEFIILKQNETHDVFYLAIYPKNFNDSVDRYIFNGDQASDNLKIKLELTYAIYND